MRAFPAFVLLLILAALGPPVASADVVEVRAQDGVFLPDSVQVRPGDTVAFVNVDDRAHTVTSSWDGGKTFHEVLAPGERFEWTFHEAGDWHVHCVPHAAEGHAGQYEGMVMTVHAPSAVAAIAAKVGAASAAGLTLLGLVVFAWMWRSRRGQTPV